MKNLKTNSVVNFDENEEIIECDEDLSPMVELCEKFIEATEKKQISISELSKYSGEDIMILYEIKSKCDFLYSECITEKEYNLLTSVYKILNNIYHEDIISSIKRYINLDQDKDTIFKKTKADYLKKWFIDQESFTKAFDFLFEYCRFVPDRWSDLVFNNDLDPEMKTDIDYKSSELRQGTNRLSAKSKQNTQSVNISMPNYGNEYQTKISLLSASIKKLLYEDCIQISDLDLLLEELNDKTKRYNLRKFLALTAILAKDNAKFKLEL